MDPREIQPEDLKKIWHSKAEINRRRYICEVLQIFDHDWKDLLDDRLRQLFLEQNYEKIRMQANTSINLLEWAARELGGIYAQPAHRTIDERDEGLEPYLSDGELDAALDEAARCCFATRQVFLRPLVVGEGDQARIVLDLVMPDQVAVIPNDKDPLKLDAIAVRLSETRWAIWTDTRHWIVGPNWEPLPLEDGDGNRSNPEGVNPYGVIPYVACHARYPSRGFWSHRKITGMLEATYQTGVGLSDHGYLRHNSSFKQLYIRSDKADEKTAKMSADPTTVIHVRGATAQVGVVDLQANLREHLETLMQGAQATLALYGIRPEAVRGQIDASSGYALKLKTHKQEAAWAAYRLAWTRNEQALYAVAQVVWNVDTGGVLPAGKLGIEYAQLGPGQDPKEQAELALMLVELGMSKANMWREVFGKDDDWIEANQKEREEERLGEEPVLSPFMQGQPPHAMQEEEQEAVDGPSA